MHKSMQHPPRRGESVIRFFFSQNLEGGNIL